MLECRDGAHLRHEAADLLIILGRMLCDDLDGDFAVQAFLAGEDDGAHATRTDLVELRVALGAELGLKIQRQTGSGGLAVHGYAATMMGW